MNNGDSNFSPNQNINNGRPVQNNIREDIPNNIALAIISMLCCCLPLGVVSLIYGISVNSNLANGDIGEAQKASELSKEWAIAAVIVGLIINILCIVFQFFVASAEVASGSYSSY